MPDVGQINPFTVIGMLERVAVPRGEWLLQTAAGSSLGKLVRQQRSFQGPYDGLAPRLASLIIVSLRARQHVFI